jgi:hypothetical protein
MLLISNHHRGLTNRLSAYGPLMRLDRLLHRKSIRLGHR